MTMTTAEEDELKQCFVAGSRREYGGHRKKVHSVAWNCTGERLASGSLDCTARATKLVNNTLSTSSATELKGHVHSVVQLCWSPTNKGLLATASVDKTVRIWDIDQKKMLLRVELEGENINITWSPDGKFIAVGDKQDVVTFIRAFDSIVKAGSFKYMNEINEMAFSQNSDYFFVAQGDGTVSVSATEYGKKPNAVTLTHAARIQAHTGQCYCIAFSPCYKYLATGGADATVGIWSSHDLICLRILTGLESPVRTLSFSHDSAFIASGSEDHHIDITAVETGKHVYDVPCTAALNSVAWNPHKHVLAYAGDERDSRGFDSGAVRLFIPIDLDHVKTKQRTNR